MSNKIAFKIYTEPKKGQAQTPKQQAPKAKKAVATKPAPVVNVNKEEEEKKRLLEEQNKALLDNKKKEFEEAQKKELDEEGKQGAKVLQNLFELKTLAENPDYTQYILNNRTISFDSILKIPEISKYCSKWTDVVTLVKYCNNLKFIQDNYDSVLVDYKEELLFCCIAKIVCQIRDLPENMSVGDLRVILGAYPLMIFKKPNSTVAELYFRDGLLMVSQFFKTRFLPVKKMVDGELKIINEKFKLDTHILKIEEKKRFYAPKTTTE